MSSFVLPFQLNPPPPPPPQTTTTTSNLLCGLQNHPTKLHLSNKNSFQNRKFKNKFHYHNHSTFSCSSSTSSSDWEKEEERWLREERRWLREEKRWVREESRWNLERQSYLEEIASLKFRIQNLERLKDSTDITTSSSSSSDNKNKTLSNISPSAGLLPPVEINQITEIGTGSSPIQFQSEIQLEGYNDNEIELKKKEVKVIEKSRKKRSTLRKGAEGEDVREMQDALQKLGFYSGEEDVEFSSFGSDTERAIKSWQASTEVREDGVMTAELLEKLFSEVEILDTGLGIPTEKKGASATKPHVGITPVTEVPSFLQNTEKGSSSDEYRSSDEYGSSRRSRVFLLGENRWEDSSRLVGRKDGTDKMAAGTMKCITCRGEGRLLCEECDGTGEFNIEEQFLEWVDEGASCPYCEGLGYNVCDVCEGKAIVSSSS